MNLRAMFFTKINEEQILLYVKLIPNAKSNELIGKQKNLFYEELKIKIKSLPIKGKANKELLYFLAMELKIKPSEIKIIKGHSSSHKTLSIFSNHILNDVLLKLANTLPDLS